ncbi:hypothetical protein P154DRAFT_599008 [Amniculicola lignicola CBS 123094]|uniref:Uncharacterized protein n=1 Tax=Amniculicola lignicola CBS 123094 TaxID=1392246 RepID=A0A6A5WGT5_9PLEO|nr:hypothetical protein P154DRAFT_599008 [Amniculicola lignicola CBS 123094]
MNLTTPILAGVLLAWFLWAMMTPVRPVARQHGIAISCNMNAVLVDLPSQHVYQFFKGLGYYDAPISGLEAFLGRDIHPLLHRSNFPNDLPDMDSVYATMRPALRIVTEALKSDVAMDWLLHVKYGHHRKVFVDGKLANRQKLVKAPTHPPRARDTIRADLLSLAKKLTFDWIEPEQMGKGVGAWFWPSLEGGFMPYTAYHIDISASYYCQLQLFKSGDDYTSQQLRYQLHVAIMVLHELGHAWYRYSWGVLRFPKEPFLDHEPIAELGFSFVEAILGVNGIDLETFQIEGGFALGVAYVVDIEAHAPVNIPLKLYAPSAWVQMWFQEHTWSQLPQLRAQHQLDIATIYNPTLFGLYKPRDNGYLTTNDTVFLRTDDEYGDCVKNHPRIPGQKLVAWFRLVWNCKAEELYNAGTFDISWYYEPHWCTQQLVSDYVPPAFLDAT